MFLKSLTVKGFKSFADATTLEMEPGVTVVVGPNGSGKSNVVDAIGWVLGAQAPSAVRSQKMDDVIFAGSQRRQALGRAEVSLTIDNSAGLLAIEFSEVTLTRILFRTGDSEYAINGVPCRLLDIQELLSDSGVGRQQHVIISQGQIDAVLNARPEDRRLIIEEAAGVLKFRRRKEKAERRLAGTEANLTRLQDLLREVRRQLRPLEKQADAARRHGDVIAELTALRLHVAGRELTRLRAAAEAGRRTRSDLAGTERELRATLRTLDAEVIAAEANLSASGGDDLGDALVRFESLRERARGLVAVLVERQRGIERDRGAFVDQAVVASLESDAARLGAELIELQAAGDAIAPAEAELARAVEILDVDREAFEREWSEEPTSSPSGASAEVRGELMAVRASVERSTREVDGAAKRGEATTERVARLAGQLAELAGDIASAAEALPNLERDLAEATAIRTAAEAAADGADETRRGADAEHASWAARADALTMALDEARAAAGAERLADVSGVVGTLLEVVDVDDGWEDAFEAAAGEAIGAVVVNSVEAGRVALGRLRSQDAAGAVLALGATGGAHSPLDHARMSDAPALRGHVRGTRPGVDALLDILVGDVAVVRTWEAAVDLAMQQPTGTVVTESGDRFGPTGWRIGSAGSGATGAARDEAVARATEAEQAVSAATAAAGAARHQLDQGRTEERRLTQLRDRTDAAHRAAIAGRDRIEREHRDAESEAETLLTQARELEERARRDRDRQAELEARLPALEAEEAHLAERGRARAEAQERLETRARVISDDGRQLQARAEGFGERRDYLLGRQREIDERLSRHADERRDAEGRRVELDHKALATQRLVDFMAGRTEIVEAELADLRDRRRRQSEATREASTRLEGLRRERATAEQSLTAVRERVQRSDVEAAEIRVRLEAAVESVRRDLDQEPEAAMAAPLPELPEGVSPKSRVTELERDLRIMGPINPLALEEFEALQERHQFLQDQLEDVKSSRRDLAKVIRAIDAEIVSVFTAAFADVSQNFVDLFETLFPGGQGRLKLTSPDDLLGTGIEIEARPSGKNVRKLSLLSGGERSLTALAYLFAIFRARPSPFYVMDEVEAALDDVNLHRFLDLVHEFRQEAQLIIVSHQKRTMEAADCLYGVTMAPGGSSRVVSEKVKN